MAKKTWTVTTDEGTYTVDLKGSKLSINGAAPVKLTKFAKKTHFVDSEYTIPLGNRMATLFMQSLSSPILAYNGVDCATGKPWEYQKIPGWTWVFIVLDIIAGVFIAGWLWALLAIIVTVIVARSALNQGVKIILSILLLLAACGIGLGLAVLVNSAVA